MSTELAVTGPGKIVGAHKRRRSCHNEVYSRAAAGGKLPSMTCVGPANLNIVKSISAAWERGDYSSVEWADANIEFVVPDGPEPGRWNGRADLGPTLLAFRSAWEEYHSEPEEFRELDDEGVLVLTYAVGRGKASGAEMRERRANLFRLRGGKVTRLVAYWSRERALADLDLAPEPDRLA